MVETAPDATRAGRLVRLGGIVWVVAVLQFVVAMIVVQLAWTHPYDFLQNAVSDLGAVGCKENAMGTSYVCSPLHDIFNVSIIVFGILVAAGAVAVRPALPTVRTTQYGLLVLIVAGIGAALVGLFPEDTIGAVHALGALLAFAGASIALILLSIAMTHQPNWSGYRGLSLGCGLFSGGTIIASTISENWGPIGFGGLERLILAPAAIWLVVVGIRLTRQPRFALPIAG